MRPRLKDIAKAAGYHVTTVSLALREHRSIPPETRQRIRVIADRLGYERDPVYHALTRFRNHGPVAAARAKIAYLENYPPDTGLPRPAALQGFLDGAADQARMLGYDLHPMLVGPDDYNSRALAAQLRDQQIGGLVLGAFVAGFGEVALNWDEFATVRIHSRHCQPESPVVGNDQLREVRTAFQRLTALGYRRIGMVVGRSDEHACGFRHSAAYFVEEASLAADSRVPPLLLPYGCAEEIMRAMVSRWARRHRIDVVLTNQNTMGQMLERDGLRVPQDVACAYLCLTEPSDPRAGIRPAFRVVGARAISILVTALKAGERGPGPFPSSIHVQSIWQDGPSAPALRHAR